MDERARLKRWREAAALHRERVNRMMDAGTQRIAIHRLTWTTLTVAVLVVWRVPQIAALMPFPPRGATELALAAVAAITAGSYFVLWLCIFPIHAIPQRLLDQHGNGSWLERKTALLDQHVGRRTDALLERLRRNENWALFFIPLVAILVTLSWATPLAIHLSVLAGWLLLRSRLDRMLSWKFIAAPEDTREAARKVFDRAITIVLVTNAGGELLWNAQRVLPGDLPYRVYSTWATLQTIFVIVLAVAALDALSVLGMPWIRTKAAVLLALIALVFSGGESVGSIDRSSALLGGGRAAAQADAARGNPAWIDQLLARLAEIPEAQPALLIAASGGGSRAALLASLVYEKLSLMPADTAPGVAPRSLADDVLLISSVSGGSLATAYFLTQAGTTPAGAAAQDARVDPATSRFVNSMETDFMAPLLRGVLNLKQERGASVASFWNDRFAWSGVSDVRARGKNRPLVVFNATGVQSGARVCIGFPALPGALLRPALVPADVDPQLRIALADAVRLSANFPYGFEYAVLGDGRLAGAHGEAVDDQIIDGGVVDNTGLDTLAVIMDMLRRQASTTASDAKTQAVAASYQRALDEMRKRGLLLIEIDAGARPSRPTWPATSFSSFSKPVEALDQAGHRNASILREHNIEHIREALDQDEAVPAVVGAVRAGFDCNEDGDVITAWALDHAARAQIFADFHQVEGRFAGAVALQLEAIARVHDARRLDAELGERELHGTKDPAATASELRLQYETYLEQSMAVDAIEHANARDCAARKREAMRDPTELTLRGGIAGARKAEADAAERIRELSVAAAEQQGGAPSADDAGKRAPSAPHSSVLGWIYLGTLANGAWQTKNTNWSGRDEPATGTVVELLGTSYVRVSPPDKRGRLAPIRIALKPHTTLEIIDTRDWSDTGLVWAQVGTPAAKD